MGYLIDDKQFINENIIQYEERMNSQYSRFLEKTPTFVTYYHINNINSITDNGFQAIEQVIGGDSPLRFNLIKDFPVYGLDPILLDINEEEEGLTTSYDSELIILPNTVQPLPNDFFTISYLNSAYLFMVTAVEYDTIKSNNYYKISFTVKSLDEDVVDNLNQQVQEKYNCILRNIGTQEKCLIREDDLQLLIKLNQIYKDIADNYKKLFFNKKYNSFIFENIQEHNKLYDKYLSEFISKHMLFNEKYNFDTLFIVNEDSSNLFPMEYENSVYRIIEKNKKSLLTNTSYTYTYVKNRDSVFNFFNDNTVRSVNFTSGIYPYISSELIQQIQTGEKLETNSILELLIIDYFNNNISSIYNFDLEKLEDYNFIGYDFDTFILIPILLFIIRFYFNKFMKEK